MSVKKYVFMFTETDETMRNLCGGKGANLGQMTKLGLPIPQGFTVTTEACTYYYQNSEKLSEGIIEEINIALEKLEKVTGKNFGDPQNPLLVSVRSGARVSMPGMMDTILNLGLNETVVAGLAKNTQNPRFAYDSYRRFIQMYSDVVMGLAKSKFEEIIDRMKKERKIQQDTEFSAEDFKEMTKAFKAFYKQELKEDFPDNPKDQLFGAINAVFRSWENPRANYYRKMNNIPSDWGTAVNVQSMVYGNMGDNSGTGVAFTRNPATGENKLYGEYLINAQGEDVVAGIRTPSEIETLQEIMPDAYNQFVELSLKLENYFNDMQDIEFTIENGKLYLLQTRSGKRTAQAALRIAVEMFESGMITKEKALMLVQPQQLDNLLHPQFDQVAIKKARSIGEGLPASPGAACGQIVFNVNQALEEKKKGNKVILVRLETSPEDIEGMDVSEGILTARGGMTSHAAVVARGMGKCCVSGCKTLEIYEEENYLLIGKEKLVKGDWIALDGSTGLIYGQKVATVPAVISGNFEKFMNWCDEIRRLKVRTNADTPKDAKQARIFGAEGIGLCRTEHMFFEADRIKAMREMIIADTQEQRQKALEKLLPMQRKDFEELFEAMGNYPVTVRYLDPPLHEFLPTNEADIKEIAEELKVPYHDLVAKIESLHEFNPMMGHRGCRLAVSYPELAEMQTRAVIEAYINVKKRNPEYSAAPEIMIPLVGDAKELKFIKNIVVKTANQILDENHMSVDYKVGTMIEIPRAAVLADEIAEEAEFFSFGTNDLTQMTFGFSRDDAGSFLTQYYERRIYESDPFARVDQKGVGKLIRMAVKLGREAKPNLKLGICGEHGGEPSSIEFFDEVGLDYVSCSPYRVPIARLAAAQATIKSKK
ncbi:MAG TPA: pyruvate, phosphate dikinase [Bacilli bacterium]|jgi:pyruvate,orthophosphate dikinase|nr:pyruvate, phosphate dikinase [Acholeplasmataceae bacterium]HNZ78000.1 pyruvate, phosphate dikinase [Bacilli bacterium]HOH60878.1 pyruvate, phosphate dikinase [Bacilli bacterium]HPB48784.1 pyruvate, phosphate dikinase [Bacilli bacterium]HPM15290.1 pyruvate, phosphate dikinase [Bacilli bacterium]